MFAATPTEPVAGSRSKPRLLNWLLGGAAIVFIVRGYVDDTKVRDGGVSGLRRRGCKRYTKAALAKGTRIERREHRLPVAFARRIARDHLCENPRYYAPHTR